MFVKVCFVISTYKLLFLVRHQLGDFILASRQFLFVVSEFTNNEFLFTCVKLELFDDLLEKCHIEKSKILILCNELR